MVGSVRLREGDRVRCNAWLLDGEARIPYLISTIWQENEKPDDRVVDRILGMPDMEDYKVA